MKKIVLFLIMAGMLVLAAFIVPYILVYNPIIVMVDVTVVGLITTIVTALLGMAAVSSSTVGYFIRNCYAWERMVLFVAGIMLIIPSIFISLIGLGLVIGIWFIQKQREDDSGNMELSVS